jgi:UDP-glucose 4-epimerase
VLELVSTFEKAAEIEIPKKIVSRRPGDIAVCYASTEKAKKELGWEAKKTLLEACADTWRWQKNNPTGYDGLSVLT